MLSEPTELDPRSLAGETSDDLAADATQMARGSGIVFIGGMIDRGLRWVLGWALSWLLGPQGLGVYQTAVKVVSVITSFSPLGLDTGVVYFVSRYRRSGERGRLKGTVVLGGVLSVAMGLLGALGLWVVATWGPWWADDPAMREALRISAPVVAVWTPLLHAVGALRAVKDMRHSAVAQQVVLPATMLASTLLLVGVFDWDVAGALVGFLVATSLSLVLALRFAWRHFAAVVTDSAVQARLEPRDLLAFSLPQCMTAAAFQLNLYMDLLMLYVLRGPEDAGIYFVAVSLASIGAVPANAIVTMFNPVIAELVYAGETARLDTLLKVVTRWLIVVALPVYLLLLLVPDGVLVIYDASYATAAVPLSILVAGQLVNTACAPAMRLIPMSGHALLNMVNGLVALVLNIGLNWLLIPRFGMIGSAVATGSTLALWSLWRLGEVWVMLRCFPLDRRTGGLALLALVGACLVGFGLAGPWARLGGTTVLVALVVAVAWAFVRRPEDDVVLRKIRGRLLRLVGR